MGADKEAINPLMSFIQSFDDSFRTAEAHAVGAIRKHITRPVPMKDDKRLSFIGYINALNQWAHMIGGIFHPEETLKGVSLDQHDALRGFWEAIKARTPVKLDVPDGIALQGIMVSVRMRPDGASCTIHGYDANGKLTSVEVHGAESNIELPFARPVVYLRFRGGIDYISIETRGWRDRRGQA